MDCIQLLLIIGSLVVVSSESDNFIITPQSVNITKGSTASFYCLFGAPLRTTWHVNGTPWQQLDPENETIIRAGSYLDQGNRIYILNMTALSSNDNHSVIQCVVNHTIYSEPAILLIQGQLQQVEDLAIRMEEEFSLIIQWMAPFSLDSSTEITYCVDVYNSTDQTLETSICGLNETQYRYEAMSDPSPCDGVDIYVIPVNIVGNGSRSHIIGTFYNEPDSFVIPNHGLTIMFTSKNELLIDVSIISDFTACYCTVYIRMLTDESSTKRCYNASCDNNEVFFLMNELNRDKYVLTIILHNAAGSSTSNNSLEFSTHDVQDISINSTILPGTLKADIQFLMNSTARGCLLILSQPHHYTGYFAIEKDNDRERVDQHIEHLPKGKYIILGYDIRSYGLPHHPIPAVILHDVTLNEGSSRNQESAFLNEITVGADGAGNICINCAISSQSDALGCVMLLHPVNDFNNITVREVNKNLQQPYCIHAGRDIFSIAVFEWKSDGFPSFQPAVFKVTTIDKPTTEILLYVSIGVGIMIIIIVMILGITIIIKYRKHSKVNNSSPKRNTVLTLASTTDLDPTPNNMTEFQYESIDGVRINVTNKTQQSRSPMRREIPQLPLQESDDEFDDPNYSTVKSFKTPHSTRKESDAPKNGVKYHYEDIDDLRNKMCPAGTPMRAQQSEDTEAQKGKHVWDESHTYSVVNKKLKTQTKCHEETMNDVMDIQTPVSASIDLDSHIPEKKNPHTCSEIFTKTGATAEMDNVNQLHAVVDKGKSKMPLKTKMDDLSKRVIIKEKELCESRPINTETEVRDPCFITVSKLGDFMQDDEPPTVPPFQYERTE